MSNPNYIPEQGDIIWLNLNPRVGHEQSGRRPAIVLSSRKFSERTKLAIICPITTKVKGLPFEIPIKDGALDGAILPIHVRSVDLAARGAVFFQTVPSLVLKKTLQYVGVIMGQEH
jgi:mRNA interferase MazF